MSIPMTKKGFEKIQAEIDKLERTRPEIQTAISEAREKGDLKENAEYHAARESLGMLEARIAEKRNTLAQSVIVSDTARNKDEVQFGALVKVHDMEYNEEEEYQLVGAGENDPLKGKILSTSPMGNAMIGKKAGDIFTVEAPAGNFDYKILKISYED